jgi:outer membrane protein OmpA-like peptidoglycan-associated protein
MLHALETYNTRGAEDIYVSFRKTDGTWTDVRNLGSEINTKYQEKTPFLSADNKTLIFASNGLQGHGSMDLFMSKRLDDTWKNWSEPVNLGPPVNTNGREMYYYVVPGSDEVIFCSTQNSDGYSDIKYYKLLPEEVILPVEEAILAVDEQIREFIVEKDVLVLQGKVFNAENNNPLEAIISINLNDDNEIATIVTEQGTGAFQLEISSNSNFLIRVGAKGYMNVEESINVSEFDQKLILKNYYLEPLDIGKVFKLNNVLFHRATSNLIDSSYMELDMVYRMMVDNPEIFIELSGHTDNVGNAKKNVDLSQQRVEVVKLYLVEKGIKEDRINGKGYGGSQPIASNKSEVTRRLNRRVEFKIIENETP